MSFSFVKKHRSDCSISPRLEKPNENHLFLAENALSTLNITSCLFQSINQLSLIFLWSKSAVCSFVLASPEINIVQLWLSTQTVNLMQKIEKKRLQPGNKTSNMHFISFFLCICDMYEHYHAKCLLVILLTLM